jgi:hypothetical protein
MRLSLFTAQMGEAGSGKNRNIQLVWSYPLGLSKVGPRAFCGGPPKNPVLGNFYFKKILTPNLVSKVLY